MSDKDKAIEAFKRKFAADETLAREVETKRDVASIWRCTFYPMFSTAAAKENHDIEIRHAGKVAPQFRALEVSDNAVLFEIGRRWTAGTALRIEAGAMLRFQLSADGTITATCLRYPQAASGSMQLNKPDRDWVTQVFEQVMIAAVRDASAH